MVRNGKPGQRVRYTPGYTRFKYGRTDETGDVITEIDFDAGRGDTATIISTPRAHRVKRRYYHIRLDHPNKGVLEASPKELRRLEGAQP